MAAHDLKHLFEATAIAVFGASESADSVGGRLFRALQEGGFEGPLYPVNPRHGSVFGVPCRPDLSGIEGPIDLAVIATPPVAVGPILRACGTRGVPVAIVVSAGFGKHDPDGPARLRELRETARAQGVRVLGPNCLGAMRPAQRLNATFGPAIAAPGRTALVSQSGALCAAVLDWAALRRIGFSAVAAIGDAADVDFADLLDYLAGDPATHSILLCVTDVARARPFVSALRSAARVKPVIVIKSGRHETGSRPVRSLTGALLGDDEVFDAVLDRAGAVRVGTIGQLFSAAQILSDYAGEAGSRLAIVTNAGGPGGLAADRAADLDIELPAPDRELRERLDGALPASWPCANPLNVLGDAPAARYAAAVSACLDSPQYDGVLAICTPQAMSEPLAAAEAVVRARSRSRCPVLTSWMGGERVEAARRYLYEHRVPHFPSPEAAIDAFAYLARRRRNRELLMQVPGPRPLGPEPDIAGSRRIIAAALAEERRVLAGPDARRLLRAFDISATAIEPAESAEAAAAAAARIGFPVAMKIESPDVIDKAEVGGVRLHLDTARQVRRAYTEMRAAVERRCPDARVEGVTLEPMHTDETARELLVGIARHAVFGPVVSFGAGGRSAALLRDRALALPPLNELIAERMIAATRASAMLGDWHGMPAANRQAIVRTLLNISTLACELPEVIELDINPLMAGADGALAVDARAVIAPCPSGGRAYDHMAIHPFPAHRVEPFRTGSGKEITIRPIRPEDAQIEMRFVDALSPRSRYRRFMSTAVQLTRQDLVRFTQIDYDREMALIAVAGPATAEVQLGVARYAMTPDGEGCEMAIVIADEAQGAGIGTRLLEALIRAARDRGMQWMEAETLATNGPMLTLARRMGFSARTSPDDTEAVRLRLEL